MKTILKIVFTALAVLALAHFLPGVQLAKPETAIYVAIVLAILRITVRPLLIFFTLPATIVSLGLFLFVINAIVVLIADYFLDGFAVSGFWVALLFSILLSFLQSVLYSFLKEKKK